MHTILIANITVDLSLIILNLFYVGYQHKNQQRLALSINYPNYLKIEKVTHRN